MAPKETPSAASATTTTAAADDPRSTKKRKTSPSSTSADNVASEGDETTKIDNYVDGTFRPPSSSSYLPVVNPSTSSVIGSVALSSRTDVDHAVSAANEAFPSWSSLTIKSRASFMLKFHTIVRSRSKELAELIVKENGKNITEALAEVAKGNETVEYACSLPSLSTGRMLEVSRGVTCRDVRRPLGVVSSVVPFNFPFMVPMWTLPIALVCGNTVVLKPSEKVPLTMAKVAGWFEEAGFPKGVVNLVNGTREVVEGLIDHQDVRAVTFVGSSPVAKSVASQCRSLHKRVVALGGAKNHLVALPDCEIESTSTDVVVSFAGCAGQRCMAASVLLIVGKGEVQEELLRKVVEKSKKIERGTGPGQMGPVIDETSHGRILKYVREAEERGAEVLLDGRTWSSSSDENAEGKGGCWIGPTILRFADPTDPAMTDEIFGPVLSVYHATSEREALTIENSNPYGNAAAVYTTSGNNAERFTSKFRAAMLGVNVGIPVPREPFSFGGLYGTKSKYGDMDITGDGATEFFTDRIKVTTRWPEPSSSLATAAATASGAEQGGSASGENGTKDGPTDHASFVGQM